MNTLTTGAGMRRATTVPDSNATRTLAVRRLDADLRRLGVPLLRTHVARTFWRRLRGLHAVPPLAPDEALFLAPCRAVQTHRLDYAIDAVFLDAEGVVLRVTRLEPRQSAWCWRARAVVETAAGTAARIGLIAGQRLELTGGDER